MIHPWSGESHVVHDLVVLFIASVGAHRDAQRTSQPHRVVGDAQLVEVERQRLSDLDLVHAREAI
eukprot:1935902-Rhodomonas_salina.1